MTPSVAIYVVLDRRYDGRPRVVGEYVDPNAAALAAEVLRAAGAEVQVELMGTAHG